MPTALLCSLASFLASVGIGLLGFSERNRPRFILAFAACDLVATLTCAFWHAGLLSDLSRRLEGSPWSLSASEAERACLRFRRVSVAGSPLSWTRATKRS